MKILVNLIGGQPAPNYIAAKEIKPDKIINLYSESSKIQHNNLCNALNINSKNEHFIVDAYNYSINENIINKILAEYSDENELILNFTGGTKIMSTAAFKTFYDKGLKAIYIDTENDKRLEFFERRVTNFKINSAISISDYFKMYGQNFLDKKITSDNNILELNKLIDYLFAHNKELISLIAKVSKMMFNLKGEWNLKNHEIKDSINTFLWISESQELILNFKKPVEQSFHLKGIESVKFFCGGWFEEKVNHTIIQSKFFNEVKMNVKLSVENLKSAKNKNELDVVAIKKEVLYIFECKSGRIKQEDINKLRAIKELFGTYAKIFLVSYFPISDEVLKEKIKEFKIEFIQFNKQSNNLRSFIEQFNTKRKQNINL